MIKHLVEVQVWLCKVDWSMIKHLVEVQVWLCKVDWSMIKHLSTQGKPDPREGLRSSVQTKL